uniref:Bromodomain-containing protein n=1 Tax=Rhizophora mucronata TaxID=61149 RepID=A0A2P2LHJ7_RHIMU
MASGTVVGEGGGCNDGASREKQRYSESKVYTRKVFKGSKNINNNLTTTATNTTIPTPSTSAADADAAAAAAAVPATVAATPTTPPATITNNVDNNDSAPQLATADTNATVNITAATTTVTTISRSDHEIDKNNGRSWEKEAELQIRPVEDTNSGQQQPISRPEVASADSSGLDRQQVVLAPLVWDSSAVNGTVKQALDNRVKLDLASKSKQEMKELRRKLQGELDTVRSLAKRIEAKELQLGVVGLSNSRMSVKDDVSNGLKRVNSVMASAGIPHEITNPIPPPTPRQSRPLNQLSISVLENSQTLGENVEKEKRTPKANQFYRNSEFLLAKDKFPPAESNKSNKKLKMNGKKQGGVLGLGFGPGTKVFKNSAAMLEKLMNHKHGWVFNSPVDVKALGLHDYFTIITHPMDLGTVKSKLNKNWYKSPEEFAEDVRLTFHNALRYNPKGQDVHIMAEQLLKVFEDRWAIIKSDYDREMRFAAGFDFGFSRSASRKTLMLSLPPLDMRRILDRSDSAKYGHFDMRPRAVSTTPSGRTPTPKKPKAKDPNKRDMTYEEKQKLSTNLQSLPAEKLDNILQIIKKRNSALSQNDDEIEVDIDIVDAETLWELDRFVTNYKKSLSKNKRKAELAMQARAKAEQNVQDKTVAPVVVEAPKETKTGFPLTDERSIPTSSPAQVEKQVDNGSRSSGSSTSSSDSGSTSSDSDSDSSSASGSDVGS